MADLHIPTGEVSQSAALGPLPSGAVQVILTSPSDLSGNVNLDPVVAAGSMSSATSDLSGNVTLDDVVSAGSLASAGASGISGNVTLDDVISAGTLSQQTGTCTIPALTNWGGSLQTSVTVPVVTFQRLSDGAQALVLTNQATNGTTGDLSVTSTSLVPGTTYMVCGWNSDGSQRFARAVVAA